MTDGKRMHWAAVPIMIVQGIKGFIIPLIIAFFIGSTGGGIGIFTLIIIPVIILFSLGYSFLYWWTYRYYVKDNELYIRQGIIIKKNRYIQRRRVQSFDKSAGILQRPFGLVRVKIETAGGGSEPDVDIDALTVQEANRLKRELMKKMDVPEETEQSQAELNVHSENEEHVEGEDVHQDALEEESTEVVDVEEEWTEAEPDDRWVLGNKRLFIAGMTSGGVGLVLSAVIAIVSQFDVLLPETFYESTVGYALSLTTTLIALFVVLIALIAYLISIGITIVKYGQFSVDKRGNDLIVSRGLLEKKQLTLKVHRITAVRYVSTILRQPFGYTTIYVESKGGGNAEEQQSTMLIPLVKRKEVDEVLRRFLPEFVFEEGITLTKLPKRARIRYWIRAILPTFFVTLPLTYFFPPFGALSFLIVIPALWIGHLRYRHAGHYVTDDRLVMQWRLFNLNRVIVPKRRIQAADVVQSPIQRFRKLSTFSVSILSSISGKSFEVLDLSENDGFDLKDWFSKQQQQNKNEEESIVD
ncbi:PH domain-containing protein [Geomicrobium sp. JCM 19055]|uniref:PH domain-containing protein n=1 Tax=Geomicrobium sp. JCM 19055 TaxID=1460649 RepID=UPI0005A6AE73|nr:PH domain-containing protein [Geomicrobium sp. JCM 19055]